MIEKFSVSDANLYKACPKKFFYSKVLGYESSVVPKHLILGINYDKMLEIYDQEGFDVAKLRIEEVFKNAHDSVDAEFLLNIYHEKFKSDLLPPMRVNGKPGNQHGFGVQIEGGPRVTGYLDKLSSRDDGSFVVVERKTTSEPIEDNSAYWEKLDLDPQIRCYPWYVAQIAKENSVGSGWVCYEVIRKLSSTIDKRLTKKYNIPIDEYRSIIFGLKTEKTLVARKWIFVDEEMTQEFEDEHTETFHQANKNFFMGVQLDERRWVKHEKSCSDYGGCAFLPICKKQCSFENNNEFIQKESRFK